MIPPLPPHQTEHLYVVMWSVLHHGIHLYFQLHIFICQIFLNFILKFLFSDDHNLTPDLMLFMLTQVSFSERQVEMIGHMVAHMSGLVKHQGWHKDCPHAPGFSTRVLLQY